MRLGYIRDTKILYHQRCGLPLLKSTNTRTSMCTLQSRHQTTPHQLLKFDILQIDDVPSHFIFLQRNWFFPSVNRLIIRLFWLWLIIFIGQRSLSPLRTSISLICLLQTLLPYINMNMHIIAPTSLHLDVFAHCTVEDTLLDLVTTNHHSCANHRRRQYYIYYLFVYLLSMPSGCTADNHCRTFSVYLST